MKEVSPVYFGPPGPGEVLSELAQGLRNKVARGEMSALDAQEIYNFHHRRILDIASANPTIPWDTGSTQIAELQKEAERIKNSP